MYCKYDNCYKLPILHSAYCNLHKKGKVYSKLYYKNGWPVCKILGCNKHILIGETKCFTHRGRRIYTINTQCEEAKCANELHKDRVNRHSVECSLKILTDELELQLDHTLFY